MNLEGNQEKILYTEIAREINDMYEKDQEMREGALKNPDVWDFELDKKHTRRVKEIIEHIGWPTASKVGEETAHNTWLLVQHADLDIEFQKQCLGLMGQEIAGEVRLQDIAYLIDRIRTNENQPQLYGTQFTEIDGKSIPLSIEDEKHVDDRRKEMELGILEEGIKHMYEKYSEMKETTGN
jgi:hypothetical protein